MSFDFLTVSHKAWNNSFKERKIFKQFDEEIKLSNYLTIGSPRTSPRTSITLNGNIISSLSPIPPARPPAPFSSKTHIYDNPLNTHKVNTISTSTMTNYQRSSYTEEEHLRLQQQYLQGRKETIISIGKNFHIQIKSPSTKLFLWKDRTSLEKCLILTIACLLLFCSIFLLTSVNIDDQKGKNIIVWF